MGDYDLHIGIYGDDSNFTSAMSRTRDQVRKTAREVEQSGMSIEQMFSRMKIAAAGALAGFSVKEFASKVVQVRGEFQQLEVAFNTMLGSAEKASSLMQQLTKTAAMTPFDLQGVTQGAKQLLAYGVAAEDVNDTLIHLGDIAAGLSIPLGDLVYLYGTTMTQGRMFTQDLRQFMGRGIPIAEELAKQFGVTKDKVQELVSTGKVGAKEFNQAILSMSTGSGKFAGLMEAQSKTITGQISNIEDAIDVMFNEIGQKSEGIINGTLETVSLLVENYEKVGKVILGVVAAYGAYKAAVLAYIAIQKVHNTWIALEQTAHLQNALATDVEIAAKGRATVATVLFDKAQAALNKTMLANPYVLAGMAIIGLTAIIYKAVTATNEFDDAQERLSEQAQENESSVLKELNRLDELNRKLLECEKGSNEYKNAKQAIIDQFGQYYSGLDAEIEKVGNLSGVYDQLTESIRRSIGARNLKSFYDKEMDNYDKTVSGKLDKAYKSLKDKYGESEGSRLYHNLYSSTILGNKNALSADDIGKLQKTTFWDVRWGKNAKDGLVDFRASLDDLREDIYDTKAASDKALKEYKDMYEITDEQWNEVLFGKKTGGTSPTPGAGTGGKVVKSGGGRDNTAEQEAQQRQRLFEIRQREREQQAKDEADLESALADLVIASEKDATRREMLQRERDHKERLDAIERQTEEWKKESYEAAKDRWEAENKDKTKTFADTDAGKAGWQGQSLTDTQQAIRDAQIAKEKADWENAQRELSESLIAAHQSYTDQKLAIDKTYNDEVVRINDAIRQAEQRGDTEMVEALKRSLGEAAKERAKAQGELSLNILKESPEYVRAFEDLQQTSSETLELLISQFEEAKEAAAQSMDPKDLREFTDTLQQMYDELDSRDPWKAMKSSLEEVKAAHKDVIKAEKDLRTIQSGGIVTVRNYDRELDKFVDTVVTEEEAMKKVAKAKDKEAKANTKYRKASKEAKEVIDDLAAAIQNVGGAIGGIAGEIISLIGDVTSVVNGALHAMENTSQGASAAIQAAEKASAILAIISAAIQVIQKISGLVKNLFGANDAKDYEKAKQRYENLANIWDELIEKKREYLNESWGKEVMGAEEEARALLKIEEEQIRLLAQQRLKVTNGSHSMWYRMWKGSYKFNGQNWQDVAQEISSALGVAFNSMEDMTYMTSEQLQWIKEHYVGLWSVMDGDFRDHLEKIIKFADTEADIIDEAMERMTGTRAEDVFSDFMDQLYELADGSEDVMQEIADNWQQMVNRMTINNLIGNKMKADLEEWYQQLADLNTRRASGGMTNEEYKAELDRLSALYDSYIQNGKEQIEQFRDMGIIKSIAEEEEEATEEVKGYLDSVRTSFQQLIGDTEIDIDRWSKDMRNTILRNLMESKLLDEAFDKWAQDWSDRYSQLLSDITDQNISQQEFDSMMTDLMAEFDQRTGEIADKSRQMWEAFGFDEETKEEIVEEAKSAFDNLHSSFLSTLTDIKGDVEKWSKDITKTMVEQMVEKNILNEAFDGQMDDWKKRFEDALTAGDTAGLKALRQELYDLRATLAEQAQSYMEALGYIEEVADGIAETVETPLDDLRSMFRSNLLDMKADAEDLGEDIGRALSSAFIDQFVLGDTFDKQVEEWKKQYEAIMGGGMTPEERAAQLSQLKKTIADARDGYAEQARLIHDLVGTAEYGDQQASVNMADKATYDQFETYLGMQTAMMIGQEQGNAVRVQILNTLQAMGGITSPNSGLAEQLRNMMMLSNEYLLDIKRSNREIQSEFGSVLNSINNKLSRL